MQCPRQRRYPIALALSGHTVSEAATASMNTLQRGRRDGCSEARGGWSSREEEVDLEPRLPLPQRGGSLGAEGRPSAPFRTGLASLCLAFSVILSTVPGVEHKRCPLTFVVLNGMVPKTIMNSMWWIHTAS